MFKKLIAKIKEDERILKEKEARRKELESKERKRKLSNASAVENTVIWPGELRSYEDFTGEEYEIVDTGQPDKRVFFKVPFVRRWTTVEGIRQESILNLEEVSRVGQWIRDNGVEAIVEFAPYNGGEKILDRLSPFPSYGEKKGCDGYGLPIRRKLK